MLDHSVPTSPLEEAPTEGAEASEEDVTSTKDATSQPTLVGGASPPDRSRVVGFGVMGALVAVGIGLILASPRKAGDPAPPALALTNANVGERSDKPGMTAPAAVVSAPTVVTPRPPPAWRVASLKVDANVEVVEGTFGKNGLVGSLSRAGVPRPEIKRLVQAFEGVRRIERTSPNDSFVVAKDRSKDTVVAFEYVSSPFDVWQAVTDPADGRLSAKKLDLFVEHRRVAAGLLVGADLAKSVASSGLRPEIVDAVDEALEVHLEPGSIRAGARMRVAATEDWVEGTFARVKVDAIEFVPAPGARTTSPLRVYWYERDKDTPGSPRRAPAPGFYDSKGRQPFHGPFRSPLALARVTSRFNPKRMHPVLKIVKPHNGVDFGASTGTPVYASAAGTVMTAGNGGPCGNMVEISHAGGITTIYCHLKGFAQGLRAGQKVEPRQLIGYVGQTGRVTGPHLHFAAKKNGVFIDPLGLKMDAVRVLPPADRDAFARKRADLDALIDGVALPSSSDVPEENEEKDLHAD